MSKMKLVTSLEAGFHHRLNLMSGEWEGISRCWLEPEVLADESPITGTIRSVLDGRFLIHEYAGSLNGKVLSGIAIYGYDLSSGRMQSAWIDSFHTGTSILFSQSEPTEEVFRVKANYDDGTPNAIPWGWRTELELPDENTLNITAWNIAPDSTEAKATEISYKRKDR